MSDRRPLTTRDTRWAKALASFLAKRRVSPNLISIASVFAAAIAGAALLWTREANGVERIVTLVVAAAFIQLRLLCNMLDGMVAIEGGMGSKSGEIYNDLPDRIADPLIIVPVGYAITRFPFAIELSWCAGLLAVMTAYVRVLGGASGLPQSFAGPMAKPHRMATLTAACLVDAIAGWYGYRDFALAAGIALIIVGCIVTMVRRTARILAALDAR
jgi:phosphatidylglycerophosphate synthase